MITGRVRALVTSALGRGLACSSARVLAAGPPVPPELEVPAGFTLFLKAHATGTQNYMCLPAGSGVSWKFVAPQATLFQTFRGLPIFQASTHFLSPNVDEAGVARATWQHSFDSSRVWARATHSSSDPNYVEPGAIPWLLLEQVGTERGPTGGFLLAQTEFIQRLNTSGGVAPTTGCSQASEVGALAMVPYSADYLFYKPERAR